MHKRRRNALSFDCRHVTGDALASFASQFVVGMFLDRSGARPIRAGGAVAIEADLIRRFPKLCVVRCAVHIVTGGTRDPVAIHHALCEVVALHTVLVRGTVGEIIESGLTKRAIL